MELSLTLQFRPLSRKIAKHQNSQQESTAHGHKFNAHGFLSNAHGHKWSAHGHKLNAHEHKSNAHGHKFNAHGHKFNAHGFLSNAHGHKWSAHGHKLNAHGYKSNAHGHKLNAHEHKSNAHKECQRSARSPGFVQSLGFDLNLIWKLDPKQRNQYGNERQVVGVPRFFCRHMMAKYSVVKGRAKADTDLASSIRRASSCFCFSSSFLLHRQFEDKLRQRTNKRTHKNEHKHNRRGAGQKRCHEFEKSYNSVDR